MWHCRRRAHITFLLDTQATVSSDNHIRVYECLEQPSLTTWQLCDDIDASSLPPSSAHTRGANTRAISTPTQSHDKHDSAPAPLVTQALNSANLQQSQKAPGPSNAEADGGWSVSWCKDRYWGEVLAAAAGTSNTVRVSKSCWMNIYVRSDAQL